MNPTGLHLYGIVPAEHPGRLERLAAVGGRGTPRRVDADGLAAVVSDALVASGTRHLDRTAHRAVLDDLALRGPVLPLRFGTVVPDEPTLRADLTLNAAHYRTLLAELADRAEVGVAMLPDEELLLREVARDEPVVRQLADETVQTYDGRLALGRLVASALRSRQEADAQRVLDALEPRAVRTAPGPAVPGSALSTRFLVERGHTRQFVAAVCELDRLMGPRVRLRCSGPHPPYSFVRPVEE